MKRVSRNLIRYNGAIIRRHRASWRAEINRNGTRKRCQNADLEKVKAWVDQAMPDVVSGLDPITPAQIAEYRAATAKLPPDVSLLDAVTGYAATLRRAPLANTPLKDAVDRYVDDKRAAGLRVSSIHDLRWSTGRLVAAVGDRGVSSVHTAELLDLLQGLNPVTRNNFRRAWRSFYRWAAAAGYCTSDPTAAISRSRTDERLPGIFTVDQAVALMKAAEEVDGGSMAAYCAIGLFAGLRTHGILRLRWDHVNAGVIHVTPDIEKLRAARYIEIRPNLSAWIRKYRGDGRVCPYAKKKTFEVIGEIRTKAEIPWPHNAMRHSFGSYLFALIQNAGKVAHEMGHHSPDMLYRHYRTLVTIQDAKRYWRIQPAK